MIDQIGGDIGSHKIVGMHAEIIGRGDHSFSKVGVPICDQELFNNSILQARKSTTIGRDVWIGTILVILSSVAIGNDANIAKGDLAMEPLEKLAIVGAKPSSEVGKHYTSKSASLQRRKVLDDRL